MGPRRRYSGRVKIGRKYIGISGYDHVGWRGPFYPRDLPRRRWLEHASALFNSIELNVYFDNDRHAYAPHDALALTRILEEG